jgi:hypothetical protein
MKHVEIKGLKFTWSEIESRVIAGDTYYLMECDNPDIKRLKVIDDAGNVIIRDAMDDELDELENNMYGSMDVYERTAAFMGCPDGDDY